MQTQLPPYKKKALTAAQLPAPAPGRVVSVPLSLWLEYLRIHNLEMVGKKGAAILTLPARNKDTGTGG